MSDLISRQDAITIPVMPKEHRQYQTMNIDDAYELGWYDLQDCIESLPSAEPKTGKWVMLEMVENVHDIYGVPTWGVNYMCGNCGFIHTAIQDHFSQYKHCPNCGARMKGADDDD